ncbi:PQQ-dependent sugar dehydrogenase [Pleurocapsales cyanobacterium LEGE 10410]|nr:PQQ-dependent sugar dehydrogenase [Pleurocapsales cyanobacterium LEGE 10410]
MVDNQESKSESFNPGTLAIGQTELSIDENQQNARLPVIRTDGSDGTVSIGYATGDDTAEAGSDYTSTSGTLTFGPGETRKTIDVPILNDSRSEGSETFSIAIGDVEGAILGVPRTASVTITDNDIASSSSLAFGQAKFSVNENNDEAKVTVVRTGNSDSSISVDYALSYDTARAGADYTATSGTLTFDPGETTKTIAVPILDDTLPEREETLSLSLSKPIGTILGGQKTAVLTIKDDDEIPYDFSEETVVSGLKPFEPIAFDWTKDSQILIAERQGVVRVLDNGKLLDTPFIDLSKQVNTAGQRGLLGFAVHPEFPQQPYVYLAFSYDSPNEEPDGEDNRPSRLIRVTADPNTNYTTALPGSEVVLLEQPPGGLYHATGGIRFGNDGSLFYGHGDGNSLHKFIRNQDVLQSLDSPFSKLYRIDPVTGKGYSDNPFFDGNPDSTRSKVYSYGLRNPFRFTIHPETNEPFIGDVGWNSWEEINTGRGANFGWPYYEGGNGESRRTPPYAGRRDFQEFYNSNPDVTPPIFARSHSSDYRAVMVGDFYTGETYPEIYQGALFFADFTGDTVDALRFDEEGNVETAIRFADSEKAIERIAQISMGPDSNLYFLDHDDGTIKRWVFNGVESEQEEPLVFQAEDFNLSSYQIESNDSASGGEVISLLGASENTGTASTQFTGTPGIAETTFTGPTGTYDLLVGYYDEHDGQAQLAVGVNGNELDRWTLDEDLPGSRARPWTYRERQIEDVDLKSGDVLSLVGTIDQYEFARVDFLKIFSSLGEENNLSEVSSEYTVL